MATKPAAANPTRVERPQTRRRAPHSPGPLRVEGAAENNLRDVDVTFGDALTVVAGVSGSGKSSLVFDVVYNEARRRLLAALSLISPWSRIGPARVRQVAGLAPAVAVGQDSVIRNPLSTVATATGIHPFLRLLYARFAARECSRCGEPIVVLTKEERLEHARRLAAGDRSAKIVVPIVAGAEGSHHRLLDVLSRCYDRAQLEVDGRSWRGGGLDPIQSHWICINLGSAPSTTAGLRRTLDEADALGASHVVIRTSAGRQALCRAPVCPACGHRNPPRRPTDFRLASDDVAGFRLGSHTLPELLALPLAQAAQAIGAVTLPTGTRRPLAEAGRRLDALQRAGLGYLSLDRPSPTLSRGEAQRVRLAVLLANRVEDILHILDEPSIGLDANQVVSLVEQVRELSGPVVVVEHDRDFLAAAGEIIELGPGGGSDGGRVIFQGTPQALRRAKTPTGRSLAISNSSEKRQPRTLPAGHETISISGATARNLQGFSCRFPVARLTVVTGPSGAGKTTLVRDVLAASLATGTASGCADIAGPRPKPVIVDQSPIGRNPRSNPATYTGLATHIRDLFAGAGSLGPSSFSFNRPEGACPECAGMGAIAINSRYLPPAWVTCDACAGLRFGPEALGVRLELGGVSRNIADILELSVDEALTALRDHPPSLRILRALGSLGLGYLRLGQPSPSLSGGEAQRVKLGGRLAAARAGELLLVDEPTTGLHAAELGLLLEALRAARDRGITVVTVEHHRDVVQAADWVIQLGPGAGPDGGRLVYQGPPTPSSQPRVSVKRNQRPARRPSNAIRIAGARANNLNNISVDIRKGVLTVLVGVSGSGKSSFLVDVLQAEASRRLLECLSMYERQSIHEGPEASVNWIQGLGPAVFVTPARPPGRRSTVGTASDITHQVAVLLAFLGARRCDRCGASQRRTLQQGATVWTCDACGWETSPVEPRHFLPSSYEAACRRCLGAGTLQEPKVERLITRPEMPICSGALHSPGFFPAGYLCKPGNGGHDMLQAVASRHRFDPFSTPWREMTPAAQGVFLNGDPEPLEVEFRTRVRTSTRTVTWTGVFPIIAGWDTGGLYTERVPCPDCGGGRLRAPFLAVTFQGRNRRQLHDMALTELARLLDGADVRSPLEAVGQAMTSARQRLRFLCRVGLGYVTLDRAAATLSAGEAQRLKLASLLGGELTGMTVMLDEPSRGLHPSEVEAVADELVVLARGGNTVVAVEHDPALIERAAEVIVLGPGAGLAGGRLVAQGTPARVARQCDWALANAPRECRRRRPPDSWMTIRRPRQNNLQGEDIHIPLSTLTGICGVSGSGKSTLAIDTIGRALAPKKLTTSVAYEEIEPGAHEAIDGAPERTILVDQAAQGVTSAGVHLGVSAALRRAFAVSDIAVAAGLDEDSLAPDCDGCHGRGIIAEDLGFLPSIQRPCDACAGTGYRAEIRELRVRGRSLAETEALTVDEVLRAWGDVAAINRALILAAELGLGHLVLRQPGWALSGGELQRLKLAKELVKSKVRSTLFILDEPTVGQHALDVAHLIRELHRLVDAGHSVMVVDHNADLLAACDWLIELGPGGGPDGGRVVATGPPETIATGSSPTAPYIRRLLS